MPGAGHGQLGRFEQLVRSLLRVLKREQLLCKQVLFQWGPSMRIHTGQHGAVLTSWTGRLLPHWSTVFAKSSGIVMLAAVAPAHGGQRTSLTSCGSVRSKAELCTCRY